MPGSTTKHAIPYILGGDNANTLDDTSLSGMTRIDDIMVVRDAGARSSRPAAAAFSGGLYLSTGDGGLDYSTGSAWFTVQPGLFAALPTASGSVALTLDDPMTILFQTADMKTAGVGPYTLRYDSTISGSYKWAVVSASAWIAGAASSVACPISGFASMPDGVPGLGQLPLSGDWAVTVGASLTHSAAGGTITVAASTTGLTPGSSSGAAFSNPTGAVSGFVAVSRTIKAAGLAAGSSVEMQYTTGTTGASASRRFLSVTPLLVG